MWKICSTEVNVYQSSDFNAPVVCKLAANDIFQYVPLILYATPVKKNGKTWVKIRTQAGVQGYMDGDTRVEYIGTKSCPECGHPHSTEQTECTECKRSFKPVTFRVPPMDRFTDWVMQRITGEKSIAYSHNVCSSCGSSKGLAEEFARGRYASGSLTSTLEFPYLICNECKQIRTAAHKSRHILNQSGALWQLSQRFVLAVPLSLLLILLLSHRMPLLLLGGATVLWLVFYAVSKSAKARMDTLNASTDKEHMQLVEKYGHGYQPVSIDPPAREHPWTLKIYNQIYATNFAVWNKDFEKMEG